LERDARAAGREAGAVCRARLPHDDLRAAGAVRRRDARATDRAGEAARRQGLTAGMAAESARTIGSAVGRLIAVVDTPDALDAAREALVAAGIDPDGPEPFRGP